MNRDALLTAAHSNTDIQSLASQTGTTTL